MNRKRVLITGAAGYLSRQLLPVFRKRYDLVLLDRDREGTGKRTFLGRYGRELDNEHSLPSSLLDTLYVDRRGVLWVGTFGGGVAKHHPHPAGLRTFVRQPDGLNSHGSGKVNELMALPDGSILLGGMSGLQRMTSMGVFEEIDFYRIIGVVKEFNESVGYGMAA